VSALAVCILCMFLGVTLRMRLEQEATTATEATARGRKGGALGQGAHL
jgi:hypothetical protein